MSDSIRTIKTILKKSKVETGFTHVTTGNKKGKYRLGLDTLPEFWEAYCTHVDTNDHAGLCIAENPGAFLPILVDVDLKVKESEIRSLYTIQQVERLISYYQTVLNDVVGNLRLIDLTCFYLEKKPYLETKNDIVNLKNGFHLHFPYIFMSKSDIEEFILPRVKSMVSASKMFENIGIEDSGSVIDDCVVKNQWLLYGSSKEESKEAYKLTYCYDHQVRTMELEDALFDYKVYEAEDKPINIVNKEWFYLPRILSTNPFHRPIYRVKDNIYHSLQSQIARASKGKKASTGDENTPETIRKNQEQAKVLVNMLSTARASERDSWCDVMFCLNNIFRGSDEGFDLFNAFSQRCPEKYDGEVGCRSKWDSTRVMEEGGKQIGSLKEWAKEDSPEAYKAWSEKNRFGHVKKEKNPAEELMNKDTDQWTMSKLIAEHFKEDIYFSPGYGWYVWDTSCCLWKIGPDYDDWVIALISDYFNFWFDKLLTGYMEEDKKLENEMKAANASMDSVLIATARHALKEHKKRLTALKSSRKAVCTSKNVKGCLTYLKREVSQEDTFIESFDSSKAIICFSDGWLFDLNEEVPRLRRARKTDKISKSVGYPKPFFYSEGKPIGTMLECRELDLIFRECQTTDEEYAFLKTVLSLSLCSTNTFEKFIVFTGKGRNGKGQIVNLHARALGAYSSELSISQLTCLDDKKDSANSGLVKAAESRFVSTTEPEASDKQHRLKSSVIKKLTGRDKLSVRELYGKGREVTPKFTLYMQCNTIPEITTDIEGDESAIEERVLIIPFPYRFTRGPGDDTEDPFLKHGDPTLKTRLEAPIYRDAWLNLMMRHYIEVTRGLKTLSPPASVKAKTRGYIKSQNPIYEWFNECCGITGELKLHEGEDTERIVEGQIKSTDLFKAYTRSPTFDGRMSQTKFTLLLKKLGVTAHKKKDANYFNCNLVIKEYS